MSWNPSLATQIAKLAILARSPHRLSSSWFSFTHVGRQVPSLAVSISEDLRLFTTPAIVTAADWRMSMFYVAVLPLRWSARTARKTPAEDLALNVAFSLLHNGATQVQGEASAPVGTSSVNCEGCGSRCF